MANLLWGKVYYQDLYAGDLREEPGERTSFTYDPSYLQQIEKPALAYTLPLQTAPHLSQAGLHPFFDIWWLRDGWRMLRPAC